MANFKDSSLYHLLEEIEKGRKGENIGITMGLPRFEEAVCGNQPGTYSLYGGNTGTGKTAFVDHAEVLSPLLYIIQNNINIDYNVDYFSFEISKIRKLAKWVAWLIYHEYRIIIDNKKIFGKTKNHILNDDELKLILGVMPLLDKILERVNIIDRPINPTGIKHYMDSVALREGVVETIKSTDGLNERKVYKRTINKNKSIRKLIVDHIGLAKKEQQFDKKANIDKLSEYAVEGRNLYGYSFVPISQFNRAIGNIERIKYSEIAPQIEDFKETGSTQEDSEFTFALFNPHRYNYSVYRKYNIDLLGNRVRWIFIIKNRDGDEGIAIPMRFIGEAGYFEELPKLQNDDSDIDYDKILDTTQAL